MPLECRLGKPTDIHASLGPSSLPSPTPPPTPSPPNPHNQHKTTTTNTQVYRARAFLREQHQGMLLQQLQRLEERKRQLARDKAARRKEGVGGRFVWGGWWMDGCGWWDVPVFFS